MVPFNPGGFGPPTMPTRAGMLARKPRQSFRKDATKPVPPSKPGTGPVTTVPPQLGVTRAGVTTIVPTPSSGVRKPTSAPPRRGSRGWYDPDTGAWGGDQSNPRIIH